MIQSGPEILRDGLCPAMLMPSKACKCKKLVQGHEAETNKTI